MPTFVSLYHRYRQLLHMFSTIHPNIRLLWHLDGFKVPAKAATRAKRRALDFGMSLSTSDTMSGSQSVTSDTNNSAPIWFWEAKSRAFEAALRDLPADLKTSHRYHVCSEEADQCIALSCQHRYLEALSKATDLDPADVFGRQGVLGGRLEHPCVHTGHFSVSDITMLVAESVSASTHVCSSSPIFQVFLRSCARH
jgi:hypothetical protein